MTKDNIALAALLETKESVYENASNEFVSLNFLANVFFSNGFFTSFF